MWAVQGIGKAFERPNIFLLLATFTDSFVRQQIDEAAVFLRLNRRFALPVSYHLTLLILQLSRLQTAGIPYSLHLNSQRGVPSF